MDNQRVRDYKKRASHGPIGNILKTTQLRVLGLVRTRKHE